MPVATPRLTTARLALDPLRVHDATELETVLADPALYTVIGGGPPTAGQLRDRFTRMLAGPADPGHEWHNWTLRTTDGGGDVDSSAGTAVGTAQVTVESGKAWLAWVVGAGWQGHGYATEAARTLVGWLTERGGLRVVASIAPGHAASEAVARKAGLAPTGRLDDDGEQEWALPDR